MKDLMKRYRLAAVAVAVLTLGLGTPAYASFQTVGHSTTVSVGEVISLTADTTDIVLNLNDYTTGTESNEVTVTYTVESNNMAQADGQPAINADIDGEFADVDLMAKVGTYTKTSGNTELVAVDSNYVTLADAATTMANKTNSTGDGKLLEGTIPITYKAVLTADVGVQSETKLVFVSFTNA